MEQGRQQAATVLAGEFLWFELALSQPHRSLGGGSDPDPQLARSAWILQMTLQAPGVSMKAGVTNVLHQLAGYYCRSHNIHKMYWHLSR